MFFDSKVWHSFNYLESLLASVMINELAQAPGTEWLDTSDVMRHTHMSMPMFEGVRNSLLKKKLLKLSEGKVALDGDLKKLFEEEVLNRRKQ